MRILKDVIRDLAESLGYIIRKKHFNSWLQKYDIKTVVDIGANEGQFATDFTAIFPSAQFHCFEPLDVPFTLLKKRFIKNKNVTVYNFALGEKEEELVMNLNEFTPSSSFLKMNENHTTSFSHAVNTRQCNIHVKRLDDIAASLNLTEPFLVKIDVQGFEDKVLAGGLNTVKDATIIIVEVSFKELYENQPLFDKIYQTVTNLGFRYGGNFEQLLSPITNEVLQADALFIKKGLGDR
jgi:FkbM family methyltransferase